MTVCTLQELPVGGGRELQGAEAISITSMWSFMRSPQTEGGFAFSFI